LTEFKDASIEELIEDSQRAEIGDHRAFDELVSRHHGKVLANCRYLTQSDDDAEDLAQEVFVKAYFGLKRLKSRSKFTGWLQKIKVNHCLNFIRKHRRGEKIDLESEPAKRSEEFHVPAGTAGDLEKRYQEKLIRSILSSMSDNLRIPLILCDMDGLSYQEAADELGIGLSAFKMRLKRAREHFRERYAKRGGVPTDTVEKRNP
jgi:RNA polymerase sigma-70 factor (ECF subfamily)